MTKSKKTVVLLFLILFIYTAVELTIFVSGHVGTFNRIRRTIADAPKIQLHGQTLAYVETDSIPKSDLVFYKKTENQPDIIVYKLVNTPENPPYVFVNKKDGTYFKYRFPKPAWSM
ncbi:hypothetical protein QWJ34_01285 [Saccharibacillus sp. CPCC 101409]|uniref:hypothetical protein n=1 Tax=Saccharibacillus sp. CPCC 101409 TaxID=3058041 RepID=UPI0026740E84|nr:hypothetical protein [Saccharibacillus sp. CPCC 101409]MDO3408393.1 hypothetical protein [Saccharibacillus sp. CPCC 101409]